MTMYAGIMAAFFIAVASTAMALLIFRNRGPWKSGWTLFLIVFLTLWTVSLYIRAMGPVFFGVSWLPIIVAAVLLLLLLFAIPMSDKDESEKLPAKEPGNFFWILIIVFAVAILIGMMNPQQAL